MEAFPALIFTHLISLSFNLSIMASKIALLLVVCFCALFLISSATAGELENNKEIIDSSKPKGKTYPPGPVVPPRRDHYETGCKRCCYLDEYGCIRCCKEGEAATTTTTMDEPAAMTDSGHQ
eukprot:Gb_07207 [translate_table: standard]